MEAPSALRGAGQEPVIKRTYEAARMIEGIPSEPTETYHFDDSIEGGEFFFSFVKRHLAIYRSFIQTEEYIALHGLMRYGSGVWYQEVIEALLYAYFIKFGDTLLAEALLGIMRIVLQHRYENARAHKSSIIGHR